MDVIALHLEVRNALSLSDELGRHEHALGNDELAAHLAATRTALGEMERELGRSHRIHAPPDQARIATLQRSLDVIRDRIEEIPIVLRPRVGQLMAALERIVFAELRPSSPIPAKTVFGRLPLRRGVPQDVHSLMDYASAGAFLLSAALARTRRGRAVGLILGTSIAGVSLFTDDRLAAVKAIPIEVHEVLDHASGSSAVVAPFVLGYVRRDPVASAIQIVAGAFAVFAGLFTDYRAERGASRALRSRGGPRLFRPLKKSRVPEVQRSLEGFAGPSVLPAMSG
jgi:hypothetical protein